METKPEISVLNFFEQLDFPGIRLGEGNKAVCDYLRSRGYSFTPDLVAGPQNIEDAPLEGLFFIDIIQPTPDLLFKSDASKQFSVDLSKTFKEIMEGNSNTSIDMLPTIHYKCYLAALNNKLDKYSHKRTYTHKGQSMVTANLGVVHHFDLGTVSAKSLSNSAGLITLLDYLRFYKALAPSDNIDLRNAENRLLKEIFNEAQETPYILAIGREVRDVPYLFLMIHITVKKRSKRSDLALIALNTFFLDTADMTHPVHIWFAGKILHPLTKKFVNDELSPERVTINIKGFNELFSK